MAEPERPGLLVVAGEYSGDRAAADVIARLPGARAFGLGGPALEHAGMQLVADLRDSTAMGLGELWGRGLSVAGAYAKVAAAIRTQKPRAALLVNYTEFNTRIARVLHGRGVRVLWYGAPQIWAWRAGRAGALRRFVDRMAVVLPFEEELWRAQGVDAHYVGHPACESRRLPRAEARERLGLTARAATVAVLPGSRPHEVRELLPRMLAGYEVVRRERASVDGRVLLAPSLDAKTRAFAVEASRALDIEVWMAPAGDGAGPLLTAFDAALCASGTACLEAALARAIPIVMYRVGRLTELAARALMTTDRIALPNILLGRSAFAELVQREANPARIAEELERALDMREALENTCAEVEAVLGGARAPSLDIARMLAPWLDLPRP